MIDFEKVSLNNRERIEYYLKQDNLRTGEYSFTTMFLWEQSFFPRVAEMRGRLVIMAEIGGKPGYIFPAGVAPLKPVIDELIEDARERQIPFRLSGVTPDNLQEIAALYPEQYTLLADDRYYDYIYDIQALCTLAGKKLHAKRNYIHRFTAENEWKFESITMETLSECKEMCDVWYQQNAEKKDMDYSKEIHAINKLFAHYNQLNVDGGLIRVGGQVVAFTVGEKLSKDTYLIHFEKAFSDITGSYAIINREFARFVLDKYPEMRYINREEDMGIPNLRKAKQSYHPAFMGEKYLVVWK